MRHTLILLGLWMLLIEPLDAGAVEVQRTPAEQRALNRIRELKGSVAFDERRAGKPVAF